MGGFRKMVKSIKATPDGNPADGGEVRKSSAALRAQRDSEKEALKNEGSSKEVTKHKSNEDGIKTKSREVTKTKKGKPETTRKDIRKARKEERQAYKDAKKEIKSEHGREVDTKVSEDGKTTTKKVTKSKISRKELRKQAGERAKKELGY